MGALTGRNAFVTGASRGVGRSIAISFAEAGASLAIAGRDAAALDEVARECEKAGAPHVLPLTFDVTDEAAAIAAIARAGTELGGIEILINNAGVAESAKFTDITLEQWRRVMAVDVEAPFVLTRATLPGMLASGRGTVISIASIASRIGLPYVAAYTAAKHALLGMTRSLAAEYARSGVTFNCVCPYYVDTSMTRATIANIVEKTGRTPDEALAPLLNPQGRLTQPEEVAAVCLMLASDAGRGITGQAINVDGGRVQS